MRIIKEFLSEEEFQICYSDLIEKLSSPSWLYTRLRWDETVTNGTTGSVLSTLVSENVHQMLTKKFSSIIDVSKYNNTTIQYYLWQPYSGLSLHDDRGHGIGATIYLNEDWGVDYGGMFMWKDENDDPLTYRAIPPIKRTLVLNDKHEYHMVTSISPNCPDLRLTIQVWFDES